MRDWRKWLEWTRDNVAGFKWATLVRSTEDPRRLVSLSEWESEKALADWKTYDEFTKDFQGVRTLTDEFIGGDYNEEVAIE